MVDKRLERMRQSPKAVRPDELDAALLEACCEAHQRGSSHKVYRRGNVTISVPQHRPHLKPVYVRQALIALVEVATRKENT
jgi:hypothetical protein